MIPSEPIGSTARKRRILIADDNEDAAESLCVLLRMEGHEVEVAHDGRAALERFAAWHPGVAILDIGMPGLDGYEVARQMRAAAGGLELLLVAVTGWGQQTDKALAFAAGFDHHFTKPLEPDRIFELLRA